MTMQYIDTMKYYLAVKTTEIMSSAYKWIGLEKTTLSEVVQTQKDKRQMFLLTGGS